MKILLDTHVLLWALSAPRRLSVSARDALADPDNDVRVSIVTGWEIAIKQSLGKLTLSAPAEAWLPEAMAEAGFRSLHMSMEDALRVRSLPWHHRDPFDRLLVAQAASGWTIVTRDRAFEPYAPILWA